MPAPEAQHDPGSARIITLSDPILRSVSLPVDSYGDELHQLARQLRSTLRQHSGLGLAAVQIGVPKRIFVWRTPARLGGRGEEGTVVNPEILHVSRESRRGDETCLSIPGVTARVHRPIRAVVSYRDVDGNTTERQVEGLAARIWLHEIDHLDGILIVDHLIAHERAAPRPAEDPSKAGR